MHGLDAERLARSAATQRSRRSHRRQRSDMGPSPLVEWARQLDDERRDAVASVGHELKTPLSILLGLCARLEGRGALAGEDAADVERIRANSYILLRRIQDLLLVAQLQNQEDGRHQLEAAETELAGLIRGAVGAFGDIAEQRGQRLQVETPDELAALVDEEKLLSAVANLVANALRHAPDGGVVRCSLTTTDARIRLEVADSGPGIDEPLRERVFVPYERGVGGPGVPHGTGLGLAVVRDIAALHGGDVTVGEAPEGGALFALEIPRRRLTGLRGGRSGPPTAGAVERQRPVVEHLRSELADRRPGERRQT
jgi:signal transduction histidine kinase